MENKLLKTSRRQHMSNPKNFCKEATRYGITYEYLIEAKESINCTNLARLFIGKSSRGGLSSDIIETWIATFEYAREHPDEEDHDQYTARRFEPTQEYHDYIQLIKTPIPDEVVESWKKMSSSALGKIAPNYGYKIGITNFTAIKTLHDRMLKMVERRKNIWNKNDEIVIDDSKPDYRLMNVPDLRKLCKDRNLQNAHIKTKDGLISLLERNPHAVYEEDKMNYDKMTMTELKVLAKERGFTSYNNLKKDELIKNHTDFDELENDEESKDNREDDGGCEESKDNHGENVSVDGGVSESKEIEIVSEDVSESKDNRDENKIIEIFKFDDKVIRTVGTYDDPWFVAKDICDILDLKKLDSAIRNIQDEWKGAQVLSTLGGPQEMTIINESAVYKIIMRSNKPIADKFQNFVCGDILPSIRKKGIYEIKDKSKMILQRPVRKLLDLSAIDIEAEELEMKHDWSLYTNKCVLYIAYIGKSLVKVGYSDCNIHQCEKKHTSCESQYEQFRMIKAFEISGEPVEKKIKELLNIYNVKFHNQSEIFKIPSTLTHFIGIVENLIKDNDLRFQLDKANARIKELEMENLNLRMKYGV